MLLTRRLNLRWFANNYKSDDVVMSRDGRMLYDIPNYYTSSKFNYKINQDAPPDAKNFSLKGLKTHNFPDTHEFNKIPVLQHGLHKLLNGKIYMGDMGFGKIPTLDKQIISQMSDYTPPSQDATLLNLCKRANCKYYSSTSNISIPLIHVYFLFSMFRRPNFDNIYEGNSSQGIKREHMNHFKKPATFYLTKMQKDGSIYSIDADKGYSQQRINEVLMDVGTYAQYLLTHTPTTIKRMLQTKKVTQKLDNYFRYCSVNDTILLRSQIDCRDVDENGKPFVFEIKTRAACPIRYDVQNWKLYLDYPINKIKGNFQSFERQYYDLIRGAFMKYAFQLKIGRMDGAFVAYHNTQDIYGYEYVHFDQIIHRLFGNRYNLDLSFTVISKMMTEIFEYILHDNKEFQFQKLKIGFYANSVTKALDVIVEVMSEVKEYPSVINQDRIQQYFQKYVTQLKNPVFKYEFSFYTYLNNILVRHPEIYYEPTDNINMKWKIKKYGRIQRDQYISFLRQAYKQDFLFGTQRYFGQWIDIDQAKEWC